MKKRTTHSKYLFENSQLPKEYCPPIIIAYDIRTPENIGSIIRLADNIACKKVLFITEERQLRESKIKKTAASSYNSVNWSFCSHKVLENEIPEDYQLVAIETASDSSNIYKTDLPQKIAFVVGNEINGIDSEFLTKCHKIVHIPVYGKNTSLNVSHALAISLFEWQKRITGL
ncbi:MAG: TrmH family RNA methyltransferase [Bacteroidales bacterium]|nr:TrmH family RNA methyltransferase [Bacteroidales bacterium]